MYSIYIPIFDILYLVPSLYSIAEEDEDFSDSTPTPLSPIPMQKESRSHHKQQTSSIMNHTITTYYSRKLYHSYLSLNIVALPSIPEEAPLVVSPLPSSPVLLPPPLPLDFITSKSKKLDKKERKKKEIDVKMLPRYGNNVIYNILYIHI